MDVNVHSVYIVAPLVYAFVFMYILRFIRFEYSSIIEV